ncbi:MAG: glycosyltransferase family 39 protein [Burkholderiaceae bacterium]
MMRRPQTSHLPARTEDGAESRSASTIFTIPKVLAWGLFLVFTAIWFHTLGLRTLVPTDEARYAEIAREMAVSGDFLTQRLNGIKYFGKPPLQAWISALSFRIFGVGEWQARLWSGLCGFLAVVLVAYTGRRVFGERVGFIAGIVLASTAYWSVASHVNSVDMSLSAMMALALCTLLLAQRPGISVRERRNWMLACWAGLALAVLSKGMVGLVLPGAVLILYTLFARDWEIWRRVHFTSGALLFLAIASPWFVLISIENPEFPHFFFIREHFQRFSSDVHSRTEPWHYFIPFLILGSMPWLGVLAQSLWHGRREAGPGFQAKKLLLIWAVFIFCFFSVSSAKLPSYILPVFPALALLIACYLEHGPHRAIVLAAALVGLCSVAGMALLPALSSLPRHAHELPLHQQAMPWIAAAIATAAAGSSLAVWLAPRRREWALAVLGAAGFLSSQAALLGHEAFGRDKAGVALIPAIQAELDPQTPIYAVGGYEYALPFYLHRTLILVEKAEDGMKPGLKQQPHLWIPERAAFIRKWSEDHARGKKALAVMPPHVFSALRQHSVPMCILAQDSRRIIVSNDVR